MLPDWSRTRWYEFAQIVFAVSAFAAESMENSSALWLSLFLVLILELRMLRMEVEDAE